MYQGNNELVNNVSRYKILFHAKRGIQELNYDAMKEIKILQLSLDDSLLFVLPHDYVNWVRISMFQNGLLFPLTENIQTQWANTYLQDNQNNILFDQNGNVLKPQDSPLDLSKKTIYLNNESEYDGCEGYCVDGLWYFDFAIGAHYGS